ncbi:MAG: hypothetical protein M3410_18750 [Acidobacteriota bacterium]|nr:hypothetical protein [Acidobacteriota bacterium]
MKSVDNACNAVYDALRYLGDASYAILPPKVAHELGDFKKKFLSNVRSLIEKDIEWIDERVAGGDRLRDEWKRTCNRERSEQAGEPVN